MFEADAEPTLWTKTCTRQADCVLLVGLGSSTPDLSRVERTHLFASSVAGPARLDRPQSRVLPSFNVKSRIFWWVKGRLHEKEGGGSMLPWVCGPVL